MSHVEEIKERLSIVDVVGNYVRLSKMGGNWKALCPFHQEKTPSFFVSPDRGSFYCFGCGAKGDIFSFVQEFEGLDFPGALKILAERAGVKLAPEDRNERDKKNRILKALEFASIYFQNNLYKKENENALQYLLKRGLTRETIKEWKIGFAQDGWYNLEEFLSGKKFTVEEMEGAGLIKRAEDEKTTKYYDRFRGRIMFPLFDTSSRVVGFSGRIFGGDEKTAKYLNSPETEVFSKSKILYGLDKAKFPIRESNVAVVVEGQMDLILSHQANVKNAVALSGTALTDSQLEVLKRLAEKIIFALDGDQAGMNAAERSAKLALSYDFKVMAALLPDAKDPADLILENPEHWRKALNESIHIIEFILLHAIASKDELSLAKEVREKVFPFLHFLGSEMEKSFFLKLISKKTGLKEEAIAKDFQKAEEGYERLEAKIETSPPPKKIPRREMIERGVYGFLMKEKKNGNSALKKKFIDIIGQERFNVITNQYKDIADEIILESEVAAAGRDSGKDYDELLLHLEGDYLKEELENEMALLGKAEREGKEEKVKEYMERCREITKKLSELSKKIKKTLS